MSVIERSAHLKAVSGLLKRHRVVAILGARQVGKTTLARQVVASRRGQVHLFDLEDPADVARLSEPMLALRSLRGLIVIDEVQRMQGLFPVLRVLSDRPRSPARFLLLGSASPDLVKKTSETLAGRIVYHELGGFSLAEIGQQHQKKLWLRGGFPRAFLARTEKASVEWRQGFIRTFLERDIPQLGISVPSATLRRFWSMLAHYHGQVWNASAFASAFGVADTTIRRYLELLIGTFVVRLLLPFHENLAKRQVKSPKVYLADSGMLHALLGLITHRDLERHPALGVSWEGFAIGQVTRHLRARAEECYFWATHAGAELDLLVTRGNRRLGFEIKRTDAPKVTRSMHVALSDLKLQRLDVIHAGEHTFPLDTKIRAVSLSRLLEDLKPLG
jgi:predicted AAA+ superfamily ATPase